MWWNIKLYDYFWWCKTNFFNFNCPPSIKYIFITFQNIKRYPFSPNSLKSDPFCVLCWDQMWVREPPWDQNILGLPWGLWQLKIHIGKHITMVHRFCSYAFSVYLMTSFLSLTQILPTSNPVIQCITWHNQWSAHGAWRDPPPPQGGGFF